MVTAYMVWFAIAVTTLSFQMNAIDSYMKLLVPTKKMKALYANPVNADGNKFGRDVSEEEAFLWFDEALLFVRAGSGGSGSNAVKFGKGRQHLGPTGGSGGNGGSVILEADTSSNTLLKFKGKSSFRANNGKDGDMNFANGEYGDDYVIKVPVGTAAYDNSTKELIGEICNPGDQLVVAKGGTGGQGNAALRIGKGEKGTCTPPEGGDRRWIRLQLSLVADVGLVGVPNAGKSTLLNTVTNARPKIASYPFTTIVPNLGVCEIKGNEGKGSIGDSLVIADIPGLLEGAHRGVGLGRGFLRHVERCRMIIHIVNGDSQDPVGDFTAINKELQMFSPALASKPQVVVLNKIDIPEVASKKDELMRSIQDAMPHRRLLAISAAARIGVDELMSKTWAFYQKVLSDEIKKDVGSLPSRRTLNEGDKMIVVGNKASPLHHSALSEQKSIPPFRVIVMKENVVQIQGELISALVSEYQGTDTYSGSKERFEAMIEAVGVPNKIYDELTAQCKEIPTTITVNCSDGDHTLCSLELTGETITLLDAD